MNSGSGIQELMAAETRASQIVAEARIGEWLLGDRAGLEPLRLCPRSVIAGSGYPHLYELSRP